MRKGSNLNQQMLGRFGKGGHGVRVDGLLSWEPLFSARMQGLVPCNQPCERIRDIGAEILKCSAFEKP